MKGMIKLRTYRKHLLTLCCLLSLFTLSTAYINPVSEKNELLFSKLNEAPVSPAVKQQKSEIAVVSNSVRIPFLHEPPATKKPDHLISSAIGKSGPLSTLKQPAPSASPAPLAGPGGPILVITSNVAPFKFSQYAVELLKTEGFNEYSSEDIGAVTPTLLNNYDVVILGEMTVTAGQVTMLTDWVNSGGTLITFRPSNLLCPLLGISNASGTLTDKYLLVNTAPGPGAGIVNQTIQFHGVADLHTLSGATSLATLYSTASTATTNPAVTTRDVSINGGKAIAFTYDLAKSVIYTRQGNPAWAGQKRDGQAPAIRSDDLFFGISPEPHWIDFTKVAIPQADEQMHLLSNIILMGNMHRKPLPRFWFLPKGLKAAIVMTGDDHAFNGTAGRFDQYMTASGANNNPAGVANWTAIRATSYVYPDIATRMTNPLTNAQAVAYQNQGFEIGLHLLSGGIPGCVDFTATSWNADWATQIAQLNAVLPGLTAPKSNRTHCVVWSDWATQAKQSAAHGVRLDVNYYYWPGSWSGNVPGMFTGSGMPMPFGDLDGTVIDCFQVPTQMSDESGIPDYGAFCDALLDKANGPEGYYGVFATNMHTDAEFHPGSDAIVASAVAHGVPVISAKQMLDWLDGRNNSTFSSMTWVNNLLSFTVTAATGSNNIKGMIPIASTDGNLLTITRNGSPATFTTQTIKGIQYAFFDATSGNYVADYGNPTVGVLHGSITLQARPAAPNPQWIIPIQVDLYHTGVPTPVATYNTTTNSLGQFVITGITPGSYNISVKNVHTLRKIMLGQTILAGSGNPTTINFGTVREGDVNNDNFVTLSDISILSTHYNKAVGAPGVNANADLNNDGFITLSDISVLSSNYNQAGDVNP